MSWVRIPLGTQEGSRKTSFFCTRWSPLYQEKGTSSDEDVPLCGRRESNPYASRHQILSLACLPISTRPRMCIYIPSGTDCKDTIFFQFSKKRMQLIILHQTPAHVNRISAIKETVHRFCRQRLLSMKRTAISGRAMMAIVALTGRYIPKLTYLTTTYVISSRPTPNRDDMR